MRIMKMCKKCNSLDWNKFENKEYCSACETSDCCAHRIWMPVESNEIKRVDIGGRQIRFYNGEIKDLEE